MNHYLKSLMLAGLMATLVIATGCQKKKPQVVEQPVAKQPVDTRSDDRDRSDDSDCPSDDDNNN